MAESEADDRSAVDRALHAYAAAFARGDAAAAARWCHVPLMWVTSDGVSLAASAEEVERRYAAALDALRQRGFSHTEYKELWAGMLGPSLAVASGWAVRYAGGDTEVERIGATYLLRKVEGEWRIVVLAAHPPEAGAQGIAQLSAAMVRTP